MYNIIYLVQEPYQSYKETQYKGMKYVFFSLMIYTVHLLFLLKELCFVKKRA